MRIFLCEILDGLGSTAIRVAFAQDRVYRGPFDGIIFGAYGFFGLCLRRFRIVGKGIALGLQFRNGGNQLWHRCGDIWQLDHIGIGRFNQAAQLGQIIGLALIFGQVVWKGREDPPSQTDVLGADGHACCGSKFLENREKGGGGQLRRFVNFCINNIRHHAFLAARFALS